MESPSTVIPTSGSGLVAGPLLNEFVSLFTHRPLHLVVLLPTEEAIAQREAGRAALGYDEWTVSRLREVFAEETERLGLWLDTSADTPENRAMQSGPCRSRSAGSRLAISV